MSSSYVFCVSFILLAVIGVCAPDNALAQSSSALFGSGTNFLEALQDLLTNSWVRIIGVIAVAALGIAWMVGRISFMWAASTTCGLVIAFGAAAIVNSVEGVI